MAFNDFRTPVEYIVDQYFSKKSFLKNNLSIQGDSMSDVCDMDESLPEYPVQLIRNDEGKVQKVIYGDVSALEGIEDGEECSIIIWQEEFIRDATGKVTSIETTYPDGEVARIELIRNEEDKVTAIEVGD